MTDLADSYGAYYASRNPERVYPVEFVVRTLLGSYPNLKIDKSAYRGARALDLGFGDGRNMPLLHDLGFLVSGVEISDTICALARARMEHLQVPVTLKTGGNAHIPFPGAAFELVLACHSCYYVAPSETFRDNLAEIARVLRPGGRFLFSLPMTDSYIMKDATSLGDGHFRIEHDPLGVRNGTIQRAFGSKDEIMQELDGTFGELALGACRNEYYGLEEKAWIGTGCKR